MTSRPLTWTERSAEDLEEIDAYVAADDPVAAERWIRTLVDAARRASELPFSGRVVPEFEREDVFDDRVEVLTVIEGHRRLPADLIDG